jgi:prepilin-type N-terminal cleavage/methylation domain-containing protein
MLKAFTLAEVLIVVAILGILAAVIIPEYRNYTQKTKESAAKENLQILRTAIERYTIQHKDVPPGYPNNDTNQNPAFVIFLWQMTKAEHYLLELPQNPFSRMITIKMIGNAEQLPAEATGTFGWIYKPATKELRLDWPGTDSQGVPYYDY